MKHKIILILIIILLILGNIFISFQSETKIYTIKKIPRIEIERIAVESDINNNGINDVDDILSGARADIENKTIYKSSYYVGGYPPENEGVCTDVIWRALKNAGIDLKNLVDTDIKSNTILYPETNGRPDSNIDFRRVPNLKVFFDRTAIILTKNIIPGDISNLKLWQPGDIVVFGKPKNHIAIISDKRNNEGVPYIIHNSAPTPREDDWLVYWSSEVSPIIGHYRLNFSKLKNN